MSRMVAQYVCAAEFMGGGEKVYRVVPALVEI